MSQSSAVLMSCMRLSFACRVATATRHVLVQLQHWGFQTLHGGMGAGWSALTVMLTVGGTSLRFGTSHLQSAIRPPG